MIYSTFSTFKKTAGKEALLDRYDCRANIERIHDQHWLVYVFVHVFSIVKYYSIFLILTLHNFVSRYSYHQLSVRFLQVAISDQWKVTNNVPNQRNSSNIWL